MRKKKVAVKNVKAYVSRKGMGVDTTEELLNNLVKRTDDEPLAEVSVDLRRTINLGNYNSVQIGVGITVPAQFGKVEKSYRAALEWVHKKLNEEVAKVSDAGVA